MQIELFGHKFNIPVEASNESDAYIVAHSRCKRELKSVSIQPYVRKDPREQNARQLDDDAVKRMMDILGMKK